VLRRALHEAGACLVGFADLSCLDNEVTGGHSFGIAFGLEHDASVVERLPLDEPWSQMTVALSKKARGIYAIAGTLLEGWGYRYTRISSPLPRHRLPDLREELPQKTVATLGGMGWVGKSSLLVSSDFGPRVRLGAVLTDATLEGDNPVVCSECGGCSICVDVCPVKAIKGSHWAQGVDREDLLDARLCDCHLRREGSENPCGLCLQACPVGGHAAPSRIRPQGSSAGTDWDSG
jgi:epoxyqueuosine reductase QueG